MPANPAVRSAAARYSSLSRDLEAGDPRLVEARSRLRELKLEQHIREVVNSAPPLTDEQRSRLAELLSPVRGAS